MAFLWKGDQLFTKQATISSKSTDSNVTSNDKATNQSADHAWTTFLLDMRDPFEIPNYADFGRFLASSIVSRRE
jgi:hypothetical protein